MQGQPHGGHPLGTALLIVTASVVASYFAVAFDRQDNRAETPPETTAPPSVPTPTITSDEFVAQVASAVADELDLPPADEGRIVELLTDDDQPGVIVVPPTTTTRPPTSTTTTTTQPPPPPTTRPPRPLIDPNEVLDDLIGVETPP